MEHTNHSSARTQIIHTKMQRKQRNKKQTFIPNWNTITVEEGEINFKVFAKNCTLSIHSSWNLAVVCLVPNFIGCLDLLSPWRRRQANLRQPLLSHLLQGRNQSSVSDRGKKLCFQQTCTSKLCLLVFPIKIFKFQTKHGVETKLHRLKW